MVATDDPVAAGTRHFGGGKVIARVYVEAVRLHGKVAGRMKGRHPEAVAIVQAFDQPAAFARGCDCRGMPDLFGQHGRKLNARPCHWRSLP